MCYSSIENRHTGCAGTLARATEIRTILCPISSISKEWCGRAVLGTSFSPPLCFIATLFLPGRGLLNETPSEGEAGAVTPLITRRAQTREAVARRQAVRPRLQEAPKTRVPHLQGLPVVPDAQVSGGRAAQDAVAPLLPRTTLLGPPSRGAVHVLRPHRSLAALLTALALLIRAAVAIEHTRAPLVARRFGLGATVGPPTPLFHVATPHEAFAGADAPPIGGASALSVPASAPVG